MIRINDFRFLVGQKVHRLFLMVWPPEGEESFKEVDISVCFNFFGTEEYIYIVTTDIVDNWTPIIKKKKLAEVKNIYAWTLYASRTAGWMALDIQDTLDYEFFDASVSPLFSEVIKNPVTHIELINVMGEFNPFGVRISFPNDFIFSYPNSTGNTVETSKFNRGSCLSNFDYLGKVEFVDIETNSSYPEFVT